VVSDERLVVSGGNAVLSNQCPLITEVYVVDNASMDGSAEMVRNRFTWAKLIENSENVGFAAANNQALRQAQGRYLVLLNSDTEVLSGALPHLVNALERHPEAGAAGPRMLNPDGTLQNSYGSLPSVLNEVVGPYLLDAFTKPWGKLRPQVCTAKLELDDCMVVDRVSFACTLIRRQTLEQVGLLDERFAFYSEDYDWFKRLKDAGWQALFCPKARVVHHWGASSGQRSEWSLMQLYRSKRLYYAKHHGPSAERILCAGLALRFGAKLLANLAIYPWCKSASAKRIALERKLVKQVLKPL
jgi:GT2 family glycosyltransferase